MIATLRRRGLAIASLRGTVEGLSTGEDIYSVCVTPGRESSYRPILASSSFARGPNCSSLLTFSAYSRASALRDRLKYATAVLNHDVAVMRVATAICCSRFAMLRA